METNSVENENDIFKLAGEYAETYYKLTIVKINQKIADISAGVSFAFFIALLIFLMVMFIGVAAGFWIGEMVHNTGWGFLIVGGIYLLLVFILVLSRKKLFFPFIKNLVVKNLYD